MTGRHADQTWLPELSYETIGALLEQALVSGDDWRTKLEAFVRLLTWELECRLRERIGQPGTKTPPEGKKPVKKSV